MLALRVGFTWRAILLGMPLVGILARVDAAPLYLVKDGKPLATIVQAKPADKKDMWNQPWYVSAGLNDLRKDLREISGANLTVVKDGAEVKGPAIHVGPTAYVQSLGLSIDKLDPEGVILKRVGNNVVLVGGTPMGTRHATRIFLEKVCDVRWYQPDELWKIVPRSKDIVVGDLDERQTPSYLNRYLSGVLHERWMKWNRASWPERYSIVHNIGKVIDSVKYGKEHPEYFPLIGGKRFIPPKWWKTKNWQPCLSNPKVVEIAVEAARAYFDANPAQELFSLAQNDNWGYCHCENCIKMNDGRHYDEHAHECWSNVYYRFLSKVCEELETTHPNKKIGGMAYMTGTFDPPSSKAHRNVVVLCVNDRSRFHFDEGFRKKEKDYLDNWAKVADHFAFHYWHYGNVHGKGFLYPRMELKSTADFLRYGKEIGAIGYHGEDYPNWGLEGPKTWITAKLLWNLDEDVDQLLKDYCDHCFGEAAGPMREFYDLWEEAWNTQPPSDGVKHGYIWSPPLNTIASLGVMDQARACLSRALAAATDDKARQRIEWVRRTLRVTEYCAYREAVHSGLRIEEHLTPQSFAELVCILNQMCYGTRALSYYKDEKIRGDDRTFRKGEVYTGQMDTYYCLLASGLAAILARSEVAEKKPASQDALTEALLARFGGLSSVVLGSAKEDPLTQGLAWAPFQERIRNYLGATALVPRLAETPTIDGTADKDEWSKASLLTGFKVFDDRGKRRTLDKNAEYQTEVRVGYNDDALYVRYLCREKDLAGLVAGRDKRDSDVWNDDSADFAILPEGRERKEDFNHYIVNPAGILYDEMGSGGATWHGKPVLRAGRDEEKGAWTVEFAIPWSDFARTPKPGEVWRAQFGRIDREGSRLNLSCWAPTSQGFNNADYLGVLLFE